MLILLQCPSPHTCLQLRDWELLRMLVLLLRVPFLPVCLANAYSSLQTQLRHLLRCATLLDPLPPQAELITDSSAPPLTLNMALLRTVLISAACA